MNNQNNANDGLSRKECRKEKASKQTKNKIERKLLKRNLLKIQQ